MRRVLATIQTALSLDGRRTQGQDGIRERGRTEALRPEHDKPHAHECEVHSNGRDQQNENGGFRQRIEGDLIKIRRHGATISRVSSAWTSRPGWRFAMTSVRPATTAGNATVQATSVSTARFVA